MEEQNQNNPAPDNTPPTLSPEQPAGDEPQPQQWQYQSGNLTPNNSFQDTAQTAQPNPVASTSPAESISWNASEFLHHEKSGSWYVYVSLTALVLAVGIYFATREIFSVVIIILVATIFGAFGAMKPKVLEYSIGPKGIQVATKHFNFEDFRSFAVIEEGALPSVQLLPQKRLAIAITMYFEPKDADKIVKILGEYLPLEHQDNDFIDKFASKIHF
jgi:hypothetical protein